MPGDNDLPYLPEGRNHLVNWEVLKRVTTAPAFEDKDAYKRLFIDDSPYDKYIEDRKTEAHKFKPVPSPLPKENLPATFTTFTSRTVPWLGSILGKVKPSSNPNQGANTLHYTFQLSTQPPAGTSSTSNSPSAQARLGLNARHQGIAFSLMAPNLSFNPASPGSLTTNSSGVLATLAYNITPDTIAAITYDLARNVPQATVALSGDTDSKEAHLYAHYDHGTKAATVGGLVEFTGFDWRPIPIQGTEHGGRHRLWCEQELCAGRAHCSSKIGGSIDVNHALNWLAWCWADVLEMSVLGWTVPIWGMVPGGMKVRQLLLPPPNPEDWMRYHIRGLQLEASHDFNTGRVLEQVSISKRLEGGHTLRGFYHTDQDKVGVEWRQSQGLVLGVSADRRGIAESAEPLNLNCYVGLKGFV